MLKHLEISGFKSFAKKSTLDFTNSVTAIVGPNGSGKSNVVEAIRFVLGEQSMKSLRGKSGSDLIFKGSKVLPKLSRAVVSIVFDNTHRKFADSPLADGLKLDFDEVSISREVFADGASRYLINGSEVRLRDVLEILSRVNIGASGHHIISQGEADRILTSSSKDRRSMVEDALGLKVYQYRLRESERKLDKTRANMKEVGLLRREIAPHIQFLKKQVEKIEKAESMRQELSGMYQEYLKREDHYLSQERKKFDHEHKLLNQEMNFLEAELTAIEQSQGASVRYEEEDALDNARAKIQDIRRVADDLSRKLGRIEGMIELKEQPVAKADSPRESIRLSRFELEEIIKSVDETIESARRAPTLEDVFPILSNIRSLVRKLLPHENTPVVEEDNSDALRELRESKENILKEVESLRAEESKLQETVSTLNRAIEEKGRESRASEKIRFDMLMKRNELENKISLLGVQKESFDREERHFMEELKEASVLIGPQILSYKGFDVQGEDDNRALQEERRRKIERIKIKLEDAGASGGAETMQEYKEVTERDQFLARELEDITKSIESLESLIRELKETLDIQFKEGIEKINTEFQNFFSTMFGGGTAFLSLVAEPKRKRKGEEEDEEETSDLEDQEEEFHHGIEINVSLPQKKVKELSMLSGGERSLTSIALLFAISQVNPPPFLVLDETDAALDEANSKRYGDMIEKLSEFSQLVVVTHNRETMSRAGVLYGVTVGADGGSKLLSIKFDEAVAVAK